MVHLARSTPPSVMADALQMYDNDIHHAFAECTAFGYAWQQAQLSLSRCGLGFCSPSQHTAATYISSVSASGQCSVSMLHLLTSVNFFHAFTSPAVITVGRLSPHHAISMPCLVRLRSTREAHLLSNSSHSLSEMILYFGQDWLIERRDASCTKASVHQLPYVSTAGGIQTHPNS